MMIVLRLCLLFLNSFLPLTACEAVTPCCGVCSVATQEDRTETHPQLLRKKSGIYNEISSAQMISTDFQMELPSVTSCHWCNTEANGLN